MAAPLSLSRADVQTPTQTFTQARVLVRNNHATVWTGNTIAAEADVASVQRVERRRWQLTLTDGSTWTVAQTGRSCCGGR